ncbi:ABC transporter substrate-binding protein [Paenibacillus apiarius]|uniref:ABC transporter substrate-binding protein n=1 Tax=Paenibacillus apiarius TaxID=46240 RepID=UPI001980D787|nr:extracellular solute-binding protein [Paenibacillus apiarius]MBN3522364.1 extracellular solute-binding protein [Paenibacillus apiarius]
MKKSLVMLLSLLFIASTVLAACSSKQETATPQAGTDKPAEEKVEPFEMKMRHIEIGDSNKNRLSRLQAVVKNTEAENPGLTIKLDGVESEVNRKDKLRSEMAAGNPPDIFDAFGSPDVGVFAKEGLVLDLTPILEEMGLSDKFVSLTPWTHEGKIYGLPKGGSIEGYFYNKKYFAEKGLELPKTLAEMEQIAEKIKADGKVPIAQASKDAWVPLMTTNNLWAYYAGAEFTNGFKTGESKWDDPRMVEAVTKHQEWVKKGYFKKGELGLEYNNQRNQLLTDEAIMMYDGSWAYSALTDEKTAGADTKDKFGFFLMPPLKEGEGTSSMVDTNNGYAFSAKAAEDPRKLAAIKSFIKNFYNEDVQLQSFKEDGMLPSMKIEESKMKEVAEHPLMQEILARMNEVKYTWPAFDALVQAEVNTELGTGIQQVIEGVKEPKAMLEGMQKVQEQVNEETDAAQ